MKGITGSTLKIIAIITMLVDHIGASTLEMFLVKNNSLAPVYQGLGSILQMDPEFRNYGILWYIMRMVIGRIAFPIFCYLLIEGFLHTKNVYKYAMRLLIFAFISEVPFDLALFKAWWVPEYQNVFFTLFIALFMMIGFRKMDEYENFTPGVRLAIKYLILALSCVVALMLRTDYSFMGIIFMAILYGARNDKKKMAIFGSLGSIFLLFEIWAPIAFIPITLYNGQKGLKMKYVFYVFYPLHLVLLHFVNQWVGLI